MSKAITFEQDPSHIRAFMQTRYDQYMSKGRLRIGVQLPGVSIESMGATIDERHSAYEKFTSKFPKKSQKLFQNIAREIIFEQACRIEHIETVRFWHNALEAGNIRPEDATLIVGGLGRNALVCSLVNIQGIQDGAIVWSDPEAIPRHLIDAANLGLVADIDTGMGNITGKTSELTAVEVAAA